MLLVTGPRLDPRLLPDIEGMDKRGYVPDLFEHLACADAAVVQGGLSTTMELVGAGRPFIYFPLRRHWEQQHFVTHRLSHYRAGLRMDYATTSADDLAAAMRTALAQANAGPGYRQVPRGGASRAASRDRRTTGLAGDSMLTSEIKRRARWMSLTARMRSGRSSWITWRDGSRATRAA